MTATMDATNTFAHVNLNEVDPSQVSIPEGDYTFEVVQAGVKTFEYKNGKNKGTEGERIAMSVVIVNDEKFSGRRIFPSFFTGDATNKQLRLLMDATGVQQGDSAFDQWLVDLVEQKATFTAPVAMADGKDASGNPRKEPRINFWKVSPAQ